MEIHVRSVQQICITVDAVRSIPQAHLRPLLQFSYVFHRWLQALREATAGLPEGVRITTWKGSLFDKEPYVDNYREFQQKRGRPVPPLEAPLSLPALPQGIAPGDLPTAEQLRQDLAHADCTALHPKV